MSYYIQNDGENGAQIASNSGWGDFIRWSESIDKEKYPAIVELCDDGMTKDPAGLAKQLRAMQKDETPPDSDTAGILSELIELVDAETVVSITDGIGE